MQAIEGKNNDELRAEYDFDYSKATRGKYYKSLLKEILPFQSEAEERRFWQQHDSSEYIDWSDAEDVLFSELKPSMNGTMSENSRATSGNPPDHGWQTQ